MRVCSWRREGLLWPPPPAGLGPCRRHRGPRRHDAVVGGRAHEHLIAEGVVFVPVVPTDIEVFLVLAGGKHAGDDALAGGPGDRSPCLTTVLDLLLLRCGGGAC